LGLIASSAGLNFQRWLQQPATIIGFSLLFVVFALNLFGLFELKLPQALTNKLDRIQSVQQGGTLVGAAVMGIISALLVGPCMTAPLAGTLLFFVPTQDQF
ncbi:thiol:disulfide interchange protein, partial [Escherichia coli]|nr:thiol:disulfide interchange protein [Escherichia coli]